MFLGNEDKITTIEEKFRRRSLKNDKKISVALMSPFAILPIQYLILVTFKLFGTSIGNNIQILSKIIVGIFYLAALPAVLKRNKIKFIVTYIAAITVFLFNLLIFRENTPYIKSVTFPFFFTCLPSFIYAYSVIDWNILLDELKKTSLLVFIVGTIIGALVLSGIASIGSYSMSLSYFMLLPAVVYMNAFMDRITLNSTLILSISLFLILALGARGSIMSLGIFFILKILNKKVIITRKKILTYILIIGFLSLVIIFIEDILILTYNTLLKFGIHSRSLRLFLKDEIHLSGRDRIYKDVILGIKNNPILGLGLAGDRRIAVYAHNIILELLAHYGIIFGSFLTLLLLIISKRALFSKNKEVANFILIWFSIGLIPLMVSNSYLINFKFWMYLGLALKASFAKTNCLFENYKIKRESSVCMEETT